MKTCIKSNRTQILCHRFLLSYLKRVCYFTAIFLLANVRLAGVICADMVLETWESPVVLAGLTSTGLPTPWTRFSGTVIDTQIFHPNNTANFNQFESLSTPAGGNQLLLLRGANTGIDRLSGIIIQSNTNYELSAAIGNDKLAANPRSWSLQLWADSNSSGSFEGSAGDTFIGQQFGTNSGTINPSAGEWAFNSFSFNSATTTALVGKELIIFLNNNGTGGDVSYYDNVRLQAVPEPHGITLVCLIGFGVLVRQLGRRTILL